MYISYHAVVGLMDMPANHTRTVFLSGDVAQRIFEIADIGNRGFDRLFHLLRNRLVGQPFFTTATVIDTIYSHQQAVPHVADLGQPTETGRNRVEYIAMQDIIIALSASVNVIAADSQVGYFEREDTIEKIVEEMMTTTKSERTTRVIDFDQDASMEQKKREGYF